IVVLFVLVAVACVAGGCKTRPRAEATPDAAAEPNRNPYRNVMPDKIKKQVEDTQKKEDERSDKVLENAK
ncbi:MAG: hypothetical protein ACXVAN_07745, partial [Polyangia bacterium]